MTQNVSARPYTDVLRTLLMVVGIGLAVGVVTSRGQTYLPDPFGQFANSYAMWLAVSFIFGAVVRRRTAALIGGFGVQIMALVGYYSASMVLLNAPPGGIGFILFWILGGTVGGPLLGLGGYWWKTRRDVYATIGSALLGATFVSEACYILFVLNYPVGYAFLAVGIIATLLTIRQLRTAWLNLVLLVGFSSIMYVGFAYGFGLLAEIAARY